MANKNNWNAMATNGLILSLVTIITSLLQSAFEIKGLLSMVLWVFKFGGCIYLLHYFMKQYSTTSESVSYGASFRYGFTICIFSSVVCAAYLFISMTLLFPEQIDIAIEQMNAIVASGSYSSEEEAAIESLSGKLPQITLLSAFIYYIVIGAVMTSIIANFTKKVDPFAGCSNNSGNNTDEI